MITRTDYENAQRRAKELLCQTGIFIRPEELEKIEVADLGLSELELSGVQILTLVNTEKIGVKLLIIFPNQCEPEHKHPSLGEYAGKEETFRCEWGTLFLYGVGEPSKHPKGHPPGHRKATYTVWHEYILEPGEQVTFPPNLPHWFQAGPHGAVVWSFSTKAIDLRDVFTDTNVKRQTMILDLD